MINASFPKCIIEVIHTDISIIGICLATDSEYILNRTQNAVPKKIFYIVIQSDSFMTV